MKKTRNNPRRLGNWIAPTADLFRFVALGVAGLLLVLLGLFMSFRFAIGPFLESIGAGWERFMVGTLGVQDPMATTHLMGGVFMLAGGLAVARGVGGFLKRLSGEANGNTLVGGYLKRMQLARGPKIVALGGGTGLSTLLRGLKQYSSNITAVVTVSDDGGSSGRLSQETGIIPPGDMRNCLVALADAEKRMTDLFQHRFTGGSGSLSGHNLGNLLISAFVEQAGGDVDKALDLASEVLNIRGKVLPSTTDRVTLKALMDDGTEVHGETKIARADQKVQRIYLCPSEPKPHEAALQAIREADIVCIGPGSVFTSVIPNLLVPGIAEALAESQAVKVYICNVMTQHGESDHYTAAEHIVAIQANVPNRVFDYVMVNTGSPSQDLLRRYQASGQDFVTPDTDRIKQMGYKPVAGNFMSESDYVRHDPLRIAQRLMDLVGL